MSFRCAVCVVVLSAAMFAQAPAPSCPADRPVDDIITEVHKQQSKMKHRNTNPFPDVSCIWGWCRDRSKNEPSSAPPKASGEQEKAASKDSSSSKSSASISVDPCNIATELALEGAHSVEVGDFSFSQRNFQGALMRYKDADEQKPGDIAIQVRLGRVYEKLNQLPQAIDRYNAALKLQGPEKWSQEAQSALNRLQH